MAVSLLASSVSILTPQQYGLEYNGVALKINNDVYDSGRYFLGLGHYFHKFPKSLIYLEFSKDSSAHESPVNVWSDDGQEIEIEFSFYYRLRKDKIIDLFYLYETDYDPIVRAVAAQAVREVSTRFNTTEYFTNRRAIDAAMWEQLQLRLESAVWADVERFHLLDIEVPDQFASAVEDKVIKAQEVLTLGYERLSQVISSKIAVVNGYGDSDIRVIRAQANEKAALLLASAEAEVTEELFRSKAEAISDLATRVGFFNSSAGLPIDTVQVKRLLKLLYTDVVRGGIEDSQLLVNIENALINV